jgi:hypothetical protein
MMRSRVRGIDGDGAPIFFFSAAPVPVAVVSHSAKRGVGRTQASVQGKCSLGRKLSLPEQVRRIQVTVGGQGHIRHRERCVGIGVVAVSADRVCVVVNRLRDARRRALIPQVASAQKCVAGGGTYRLIHA